MDHRQATIQTVPARSAQAQNLAPRRSLALIAAALLIGVSGGMLGCNRSPLRVTDERSQFDRYDQTRNALASPYLEDEFGRRQPNLRGRLLPKE